MLNIGFAQYHTAMQQKVDQSMTKINDTREQCVPPIHVVVMGVAGAGKSTIAEAIRDRMGYMMAEGDDFHPQANIDKMSHGIPLTDEDRRPWLEVINRWMIGRDHLGESTVVSSSALKRIYRDVLRADIPVLFLHLSGSQQLIQQRLARRTGHFMPPALLPSQFAALEPLQADETGVEISVEGTAEDMIERSLNAVLHYAQGQPAPVPAHPQH